LNVFRSRNYSPAENSDGSGHGSHFGEGLFPTYGGESSSPIEISTSLGEAPFPTFEEAAFAQAPAGSYSHHAGSHTEEDLQLSRKESASRLRDMFPEAEPEAVSFILDESKNDLAVAVRSLLEMWPSGTPKSTRSSAPKKPTQRCQFSRLPEECVFQIFRHCSSICMGRLANVSLALHSLVNSGQDRELLPPPVTYPFINK